MSLKKRFERHTLFSMITKTYRMMRYKVIYFVFFLLAIISISFKLRVDRKLLSKTLFTLHGCSLNN